MEPYSPTSRPSAGPLPLLLTVDATARELGLSVASVWRLCRQQRLRAYRLGRATRIPRASVEALIADLEAGQPLIIRTRTAVERRRAAERRATPVMDGGNA